MLDIHLLYCGAGRWDAASCPKLVNRLILVGPAATTQVLNEVHREIHAGSAPLVAFEHVARSRLGNMVSELKGLLGLMVGRGM